MAAETVLLACTCVNTGLVCTIEMIHVLCNAKGYCNAAFQIAEQWFIGPSGPKVHEHSGAQIRLASRLTEIRVESYLVLLNVAMHIAAALAASWLLRLMLGLPHVGDPITISMIGVAYFSALALRVCPSMLNQNNIWILHCWNMALLFCLGAYLAFWEAPWFVNYYPPILAFRTCLSLVYPVARSNNFWNVAWVVVAIFGRRNAGGATADIPLSNVIMNEVVVASLLCYMVCKLESLQTSQVRSDILANVYLRAKKTMERLLADMCDAVVELDPDFVIRTNCPKLGGLLLREAGTSLKNETFSNLAFTEQDRVRFVDFVAQRAVPVEQLQDFGDGEGRSSMYLHLRDAIGTPVSAQLFHSCHYDTPDDVCHIVGVREVDRDTHVGGAMDVLGDAGRPMVRSDDVESVVSVASVSTGSGASDLPVELAPLIPEGNTDFPVGLIFNPYTNEIIACTLGFRSLTGPVLMKASLRDFIVNYKQFNAWVYTELDGLFKAAQAQKIELKVSPSTMKKQANYEFHADAFILDVRVEAKASAFGVQRPQDPEEEEVFEVLCVLVLGKPVPKWQRKKHKKNKGNRVTMHHVPDRQSFEYTVAL